MANTYIEPSFSDGLDDGRRDYNDSARTILTNLNGPVTPTSSNFTVGGADFSVPDGTIYYSSNGASYVSDSANKKHAPIGGNFTRYGISYRSEASLAALTANVASYEPGELVTVFNGSNDPDIYRINDNNRSSTSVVKLGSINLSSKSVREAELADNSIITRTIQNDAVTSAKISSSAVTAAKISDNSIDSNHIDSGAVTNSKFKSISGSDIKTKSITSSSLVNGSLGLSKFAISGNGSNGQVIRRKNNTDEFEWHSLPTPEQGKRETDFGYDGTNIPQDTKRFELHLLTEALDLRFSYIRPGTPGPVITQGISYSYGVATSRSGRRSPIIGVPLSGSSTNRASYARLVFEKITSNEWIITGISNGDFGSQIYARVRLSSGAFIQRFTDQSRNFIVTTVRYQE